MPLTQEQLGSRLQAAREAAGLTQQDVATGLAIPRSAVAEFEAGRRRVSGLELDRLAHLFGRIVSDLLEPAPLAPDPVSTLLRASQEIATNHALQSRLRGYWSLCNEVEHLERELGMPTKQAALFAYELPAPSSKWEAIRQGQQVATLERNRLNLGASPVWELPEVLQAQGVRVTEEALPDGVSGAFLYGKTIGPLIIVNENEHPVRRLFSYAHEYAHALLDRARSATVSRRSDNDDLLEVRANAFAAHFLMPEAGVFAFLASRGKGEIGRQVQVVPESASTGGGHPVFASKRLPTASQAIQIHDIVLLAHAFGVSYSAALFHLMNLKVLTREQFEALQVQEDQARRLARALRGDKLDDKRKESEKGFHWKLSSQVLSLGLEAYRREVISRRKLVELAKDAGIEESVVGAVLADAGLNDEPAPAPE
jgi:Zn-dependent peptidase ImmA (M78 family)/DNA-binding XRE family transcriptional regulator